MNTRGKHTLFRSTVDMIWYICSFVASSLYAQKHFRGPVTDLLDYLERTLTPLSKEILGQNQQLIQIKGLLFKILDDMDGSGPATGAQNDD